MGAIGIGWRFAIGVIVFFMIVTGIFFVSSEFSRRTADYRGETQKREQVEANGARRIANYEKFHNLCNDIQAKNEEITNSKAMLSGKKEKKVVFALTQTKTEMVGDYNSLASQDYTSGQFRDSDLPYQIESDDMEVECGA